MIEKVTLVNKNTLSKDELIRRLKLLEAFNNSDVPKWVYNVIEGCTIREEENEMWISEDR